MRQIQKVNREKEKEAEALARQPMKAVYKPEKFAHVDSKVAQDVKVNLVHSKCQMYFKNTVQALWGVFT